MLPLYSASQRRQEECPDPAGKAKPPSRPTGVTALGRPLRIVRRHRLASQPRQAGPSWPARRRRPQNVQGREWEASACKLPDRRRAALARRWKADGKRCGLYGRNTTASPSAGFRPGMKDGLGRRLHFPSQDELPQAGLLALAVGPHPSFRQRHYHSYESTSKPESQVFHRPYTLECGRAGRRGTTNKRRQMEMLKGTRRLPPKGVRRDRMSLNRIHCPELRRDAGCGLRAPTGRGFPLCDA
jgi:hypothetical protein